MMKSGSYTIMSNVTSWTKRNDTLLITPKNGLHQKKVVYGDIEWVF